MGEYDKYILWQEYDKYIYGRIRYDKYILWENTIR